MQTITETPADWLLEQFEETFGDYQEGHVTREELGLGSARRMAELIDDLAEHSWPRCYICGWIAEEKEPDLLRLVIPSHLNFFSLQRTSGRYLQRGLPPV